MNSGNPTTFRAPGASVKSLLIEEEAFIKAAHASGAGGGEIVQRRTGLIDRVLKDVHRELFASGPAPTLLAIGGYGRGELNPYSDIDLMFLCRDEAERQRTPEMLYALWDAGLDIGYSVRTAAECVDLALQDIKIRTSLLEARFLAGDAELFDAFRRTMHAEVFYRDAARFITGKLTERAAARQKYGGSLYLREPNIKESAGGLRDVHTALWIAYTHFRISSLAELVSRGVITAGAYAVFLRSRNFLWRIRNELHYDSGRKNDQLTFDLQDRAAAAFRYRDSAHLSAVERFMKAYFLHARNILEFSRMIAAAVLPPRKRSWFPFQRSFGPFLLADRTLLLRSVDPAAVDADLVVQAFLLHQRQGAAFSDGLAALIKNFRIDDAARRSPGAAEAFLEILNRHANLADTLTLMRDLKFLGRYLPEFRAVQALARHDYYHTYTVDEHILHAIRHLEDLAQGRHPGPVTLTDALHQVPKKWVLVLAVLLHDLGKAHRERHELRGVEIAGGILDRLGVAADDRRRILFLIENHLLMAGLAQRRELSDDKVIADFARTVGDRSTLAMLYLLTYADIAAVRPGAWTPWKAALLQDLYLRTADRLEQQDAAKFGLLRLDAARERIRQGLAARFSPEEIEYFFSVMPEKYLLALSPSRAAEHLAMMLRLPAEHLIIEHRHVLTKGYTELTVCAYDAYGMFYRTAGTIAAQNLNIVRAQVHTAANGVMIDTFQITDVDGALAPYDDAWAVVKQELRRVLTGGGRPPEPGRAAYASRKSSAPIPPAVSFDNETSDSLTIIDITARDRVGLLYRITRTLFDLNLDIASAKIVTEGPRVLDSFYVSDLFKQKIADPLRLDKIRDALLAALHEEQA